MPYTFTTSAITPPYFAAFPSAYAVITNIAADIKIVNGQTVEPKVRVFYALYMSKESFLAGGKPGDQGCVEVTPSSPIMPQIESQLAAVIGSIPGVTNVTAEHPDLASLVEQLNSIPQVPHA